MQNALTTFFNKQQLIDTKPVYIKTQLWFWTYCLLHLVLWTLAPTFFRATIPFDSAEGYAWGNQLQWGYDKHPFIAPWLTALFAHLGDGVGFATYFASQLCVIVAFIAIWQLAKKILSPFYALIAIFIMGGLDFYTLASNKIDPDILTLATWAVAILWFYNACSQGNYRNWFLAGFTAGLAMMSKYTTVLLLISMFSFLLIEPNQRRQFKNPALYVGLITFLLTILPNTIWQFQHHFISLTYAVGRGSHDGFIHHPILNHLIHPISFLLNQIFRALLLLLIGWPLLFCPRFNKNDIYQNELDYKFNTLFLLILFSGPFIIAILLSAILGIALLAGWAFPFFTLAGIALVFFLRPIIHQRIFKWLIISLLIVSCSLLVARYTVMNVKAYFTHKADKSQYPMQQIADYVTQQWHQAYHRPLRYVAGSRYLTAFISAYSSDHPIPYFNWNPIHSAWINQNNLRETGAMFVWWANGQKHPQLPQAILTRFPTVKDLKIIHFTMLSHAKLPSLAIDTAILPPAK